MDLSFNFEQFVIFFFVFSASLFVLNHFVFRPTFKILGEREQRMDGKAKEAEYFAAQYDEKFKEYEKLMVEAKQFARQKRDEILKTAENEKRDIITESQKISEALLKDAQAEISTQQKEAQLQLKSVAKDLSTKIVDKLLGKKVA